MKVNVTFFELAVNGMNLECASPMSNWKYGVSYYENQKFLILNIMASSCNFRCSSDTRFSNEMKKRKLPNGILYKNFLPDFNIHIKTNIYRTTHIYLHEKFVLIWIIKFLFAIHFYDFYINPNLGNDISSYGREFFTYFINIRSSPSWAILQLFMAKIPHFQLS